MTHRACIIALTYGLSLASQSAAQSVSPRLATDSAKATSMDPPQASLDTAAARPAAGAPATDQGRQPFSLDLSLDGYRSSDSGHAQALSATFGVSGNWTRGILSISPSLQADAQRDDSGNFALSSGTADLDAALRILPWLAVGVSGYYATWEGPDDYGGTLRGGLSGSLPTGTRLGLTGTVSRSRWGSATPSAGLSAGHAFGPLAFALGGGWSWERIDFLTSRIRTTNKGTADTIEADTSARSHLLSASASLTWKGEDWDFGPFAGYTYQEVPLGSETLVAKTDGTKATKGSTSTTATKGASSSSSATARNRTWKLGWSTTWTPTESLLLDLTVANTWSDQTVRVTQGKSTRIQPATLALQQQRDRLQGRASPPAAGLSVSLSASLDL